MKQKKVTFKLFLNKSLTPQNEKYYPVYFRITYNRQNTKISDVLFNDHTLFWSEEELDAFERGFYSGKTRQVAEMVKESMTFYEDVIRYEAEKAGEDYSVIGLAERAKFYRNSFLDSFNDQVSYFAKMEACVNDGASISALITTVRGHNSVLSTSFIRMQELSILLQLYLMPYYNLNLSDSFFTSSIYYWEMKAGMAEFKDFLARYFSNQASIDPSHLEERFQHNTPESRYLKPLYNSFPPQVVYEQLYFKMVKAHLQAILPSG